MEVWGLLKLDLGRPRCILETNRVDRRPEKSAASSDFGEGRVQKDEKLGFWGTGQGAALDFDALRGKCEVLVGKTLFEAQYRLFWWWSWCWFLRWR